MLGRFDTFFDTPLRHSIRLLRSLLTMRG